MAAIPLMLRIAVPVLVKVMDCAVLVEERFCEPNARALRLSDTSGTATPVPLRLTLWGEPVALLVMVIVPALVPAAVGAKFTLIAQFAPGARVAAQPLVEL